VPGLVARWGAAFEILARERPDALLVDIDPFMTSRRVQLVTLAARHAIRCTAYVASWHRCEVLECPLLRRFQEQTGPSSDESKPTLMTHYGPQVRFSGSATPYSIDARQRRQGVQPRRTVSRGPVSLAAARTGQASPYHAVTASGTLLDPAHL
jgi:hypothetical protein